MQQKCSARERFSHHNPVLRYPFSSFPKEGDPSLGGLIPLSDATRRPRNFPIITVMLIAVNVFVFILELVGGNPFVTQWSLVPADVTAGHNLITILTSMFMHASWSHILGNMIFLWAFGPAIEDAMNPLRYLIFYLVGGLVAMLAQVAASPGSTVPNLGASGAIAAVMGAFLVTYPRDQIRSILFIGWFFRITFIPAALLIGFWFLIQLVSFGVVANVNTGGVAYLAHIGGVAFGALTARLFEDRSRMSSPYGFE
jgi:membrane associated rhomboid family serine protease